jgi:hypothetical protein
MMSSYTYDPRMSKFVSCALVALFASVSCWAETMEEFEFEFMDYYDPTAENAQSAIAVEMENLSIRGDYKERSTRTYLDTSPNCGHGAPFCFGRLPSFETYTETSSSKKQASNISVKGNKIRFQLPDSDNGKYRESIWINDHELYSWSNSGSGYPATYLIKTYNYNKYNLYRCNFVAVKQLVYKLSHVKDGQTSPDTRNGEKRPLVNDVGKDLERHVKLDCSANYVTADFAHALGRYFPKGQTNALRVSVGTLDAINIKNHPSDDRSPDVVETRYAKDGKLLWIKGRIAPGRKSGIYLEDEHYTVYFYPDGSTKRYFMDEEWKDLTHVKIYENNIRERANKETASKIISSYTAYMRYILSASPEELQKEFDLYKRNSALIEPERVSKSVSWEMFTLRDYH